MQFGERLGEWVIVGELGRGGMGAVFKVRHAKRGQLGALKVMSGLTSDVDEKRFLREAQAGASIEHPNVLPVLEAGRDAGRPFLVLDLAEGGSLAERLRRDGKLTWADAASIGAGIAHGLAAIHAQGLVHRDLKPANVLFGRSGEPRVADFGLVKDLDSHAKLTETSSAVGTPQYMAPEQANGSPIDPRADLYSLGCVLHALLTGEPPFPGSGYEVMKKHMTAKPPSVREGAPDVPARFEALVLRLLAKSAAERGSAAEAAAELEAIAAASGKTPRGPRTRVVGLAVLVSLAFLLATTALVIATRRPRGDSPPADAPAAAPSRSPQSSPVASSATAVPAVLPTVPRSQAPIESTPSRWGLVAGWGDARWKPTHRRPIDALAFSPDGSALLCQGDVQATLFAVESGELRAQANAYPRKGALAIAFSPDGSRAAIAYPRSVEVRDAGSLKLASQPLKYAAAVKAIAFSADGIFCLCEDGVLEKNGASARYSRPFGKVVAAAFGPLASTVLVVGGEKTARLCAIDGGNDLELASQGVLDGAVSSDGTRVLLERSSDLEVFDGKSGGRLSSIRKPEAGDRSLDAIAVSGAKVAISGSRDGVFVYDASSGAEIWCTHVLLRARKLAFSADGRLLAAAAEGCEVRVFDAANGSVIAPATQDRFGPNLSLSASGKRFATSTTDGALRFIDLEAGTTRRIDVDSPFGFDAVALSPDGRRVLSIERTFVVLRDFDSGGVLWRDPHPSQRIAWSGDGATAITASTTGLLTAWSWNGREMRRRGRVSLAQCPAALDVSFDGSRAAALVGDALFVVDLTAEATAAASPLPTAKGQACAISADGKQVAVDDSGEISVFSAESGALVRKFGAPVRWAASHLGFSRDGLTLIATTYDGKVREYALPDGRECAELAWPSASQDLPISFSMSATGQLLVGTARGLALLYERR